MALISPVFNIPYFTDNNGNPLAGGKVFQYEAGSSSVLKTTYTTAAGDVANANPIVLNSAGQLPTAIFLTSGQAYNLVLTASDGTTVLKGFDNVVGVDTTAAGGGAAAEVWIAVGSATYLSPTSFLVPGNLVAEFGVGNRVRITLSGGDYYGTVSAVSYSTPNTTVTVLNDTSPLNSSVSDAAYSTLTETARAVDAGGVSYFTALPYTTANTVGNKLKSLDTDILNLEADVAAQIDALEIVVANGAPPVGTVSFYAGSSAPTGWLMCNGALLSRTTYAALFAVIGVTYGAGDGLTTFALPDMRGVFARGLDAGRGVDSGRVLGSLQGDEFRAHTHGVRADNGGWNTNTNDVVSGTDRGWVYTAQTISSGGAETRPINLALNAIIKV